MITDFKALTIPEGEVVKIKDSQGRVLWTKPSALPYDAEIEYLNSDGASYIDTGVLPLATISCILDFSLDSNFVFGNSSFLFGSYKKTGNTTNCAYSIAIPNATQIRTFGGTSFTNITCGTFGTSSHIISYQFGSIKYDNIEISQVSGKGNSNAPNIRLFGRSCTNIADAAVVGKFRIYSFIMLENNSVVRDFIPVRVGQVGYMYDKVSGQLFGNAGTGDFVLGPDK